MDRICPRGKNRGHSPMDCKSSLAGANLCKQGYIQYSCISIINFAVSAKKELGHSTSTASEIAKGLTKVT
ncbi:hypothetical protein CHS0354_037357 [Potamilus streckersoni]|uniref:Uncharacterized protein n=1 Tax=Potamilus streckersoni TaxID=2493646 RepID=A0AAE0VQ80_9BIVA|nr:hypothetical protein CHS0354_037357 [Potamilus streckersoni]